VVVEALSELPGRFNAIDSSATGERKPYFIGQATGHVQALPEFSWSAVEKPLRKTSLNATHRQMGAKMVPFAGWDMPVWYTSVVEEHLATRQAAGLFDVSHMGVYQAEGPDAAVFLDSVCGNDIAGLAVGESCYTHFLDPDANVIDDTLVYHRGVDKFLVVVNAANDDKDWAWLNQVRLGKVLARWPSAAMWSCVTCATRLPGMTCAWTSPCRVPARGISCWPWAATAKLAPGSWP